MKKRRGRGQKGELPGGWQWSAGFSFGIMVGIAMVGGDNSSIQLTTPRHPTASRGFHRIPNTDY